MTPFKKFMTKTLLLSASLVAGMTALSSPIMAQNRNTVRIENNSHFQIRQIFMSSVGSRWWGKDVLGSDVLYSDYTTTIWNIQPGYYDLKFVDQDGDACIVPSVDLYNSHSWSLTDYWLLRCEFH